jgi:hypothetical protein
MVLATKCRGAVFACAGLAGACDGGSDMAPAPQAASAQPAAIQPVPTPSPAALALFEAARVHYAMTTAPFMWFDAKGAAPTAWLDGHCALNEGSAQDSLDGGSPAASVGPVLPSGSHTYSVNFLNCRVDGLSGISMMGSTSVAYSTTDWRELTAQVSPGSIRATGSVDPHGVLADVSATGSGTWTLTTSSDARTDTYTPAAGSTLVNNLTTHAITFQSGSLVLQNRWGPVAFSSYRATLNEVVLTLKGVTYVMDGSVQISRTSGVDWGIGEVLVSRDGALVARIFTSGASIQAEAYATLESF